MTSLVQETFVSSLDFYVSDEEVTSTTSTSSTSNLNNSLPVTSSNLIKGRNTAVLIKPTGGRKAKQDAILALNTSTSTSNSNAANRPSPANSTAEEIQSENESSLPSSKRNPVKTSISNKVPRAPPLDFTTIRTSAPRYPNPPARPIEKPNRIFDLEHAPIYHPSILEFAKPMEYIESIALEAKEFGICKIVPPEGWRPPFALNTEVRFFFFFLNSSPHDY